MFLNIGDIQSFFAQNNKYYVTKRYLETRLLMTAL
jgi:hypothetical protein